MENPWVIRVFGGWLMIWISHVWKCALSMYTVLYQSMSRTRPVRDDSLHHINHSRQRDFLRGDLILPQGPGTLGVSCLCSWKYVVKVERDVVGRNILNETSPPAQFYLSLRRLHVYVASFNGEINVVFIVIPSTINDFGLVASVYLLKEQKTKIIIL